MKENIILLTQNGSRVYGTHTPTSDWDYVGVAIPPVDYYLGLSINKLLISLISSCL